eukprot:scaffold2922_cov1453-Pavlova_lutheri.AAC.2
MHPGHVGLTTFSGMGALDSSGICGAPTCFSAGVLGSSIWGMSRGASQEMSLSVDGLGLDCLSSFAGPSTSLARGSSLYGTLA